jgi:hypothetical protein
MCALNVYTHYDLRILNFWKAFQRLPLPKELSGQMFLGLKRQLVDDLDSLRDSIATDVLQDIPAAAIETSLATLQDIKERIKGFAEPPGSVAAK